jgi:hypothetical protein
MDLLTMRILDALIDDEEQLEEVYLGVNCSRHDDLLLFFKERYRLSEIVSRLHQLQSEGAVVTSEHGRWPAECGISATWYSLTDEGRRLWSKHVSGAHALYELAPQQALHLGNLDDLLLESTGLSPFQSKVLEVIREHLAECTPNALQACVERMTGRIIRINVQVRFRECASFRLLIHPENEIGVSMGKEAYFNIPEDVEMPTGASSTDFLAIVLRTILSGGLTEVVFSYGDKVYKSEFTLRTPGRPVTIKRVIVPWLILGLWRRPRKRVLTYDTYPMKMT